MYGGANVGKEQLASFLRALRHKGQTLVDPERCHDAEALRRTVARAEALLDSYDEGTPIARVASRLQRIGFNAGWGRDVGTAKETLGLLAEIMQVLSVLHFSYGSSPGRSPSAGTRLENFHLLAVCVFAGA